jgi:hypothetical protein
MPEVSRIALEWGSVANSLARIKQDLLPEEIARDDLAQWVMSFDTLQNEANQRGLLEDQIELDNRYDWESQLYSYLVTSILQVQMPFYFASLFHIGRQWQVALFSLESITDVEQEENLFASAQNLIALNERSRRNADLTIESSVELIRRMCQQGRRHQTRQLNLAREWWQDWRSEVKFYRGALDEFREYFYSIGRYENRRHRSNEMARPLMRLYTYSMRGSTLRREMQRQGVQFKPEIAMQPPSNQQILWIPFAMALVSRDEGRFFAHEMFADFIRALRRQELAPKVEIALERLKWKYGEADPFMNFSVGKSAPTPELLELIREHVLPDGSDSPWLDAWKRTLDNEPNRYEKLPKLPGQFGRVLALSVRSADSTIKRNLTQQLNPAESWEDFLQRIFEKKWIQAVGIMAGRTNQDAKPPQPTWDLQAFRAFIAGVVARLNKLGYSLTVPNSTRLSLLLERASKSKSPYEDMTW